jgi:glutathione S-transferase
MAVKPLTFYSHREQPSHEIRPLRLTPAGIGPNPWKTVTVLEELNIPYETIFLDFGAGKNGVEGSDFKKKNPAGRVPLIYDPNTGS